MPQQLCCHQRRHSSLNPQPHDKEALRLCFALKGSVAAEIHRGFAVFGCTSVSISIHTMEMQSMNQAAAEPFSRECYITTKLGGWMNLALEPGYTRVHNSHTTVSANEFPFS